MASCELIHVEHVVKEYKKRRLPVLLSRVPAGMPSPAEDEIDHCLDLNDHLIKNPASTFFVRVTGDSMIGAGIFSGDILVIDRSLPVKDGSIVIAMIDGEFMVKRLRQHDGAMFLLSENSQYTPIEVKDRDLTIWGVVNYTIHRPE